MRAVAAAAVTSVALGLAALGDVGTLGVWLLGGVVVVGLLILVDS